MALALLALGGALLAGSAHAGRSAWRSMLSNASAVTSDGEGHTVLFEIVTGWSASNDSLSVGQSRSMTVGPRRLGAAGLIALTRARVLRISPSRFIVALDVAVGPTGVAPARRRMCLIVERETATDTSAVATRPRPIAQWSTADLF